MAETPTVGIVILNRNGKAHLDPCLGAIQGLSYPKEGLTVVLADNGSSDGSVEYVRQTYAEVQVCTLGENLGFSSGNNRAIETLKTDYILTLNNDTAVEPGFLEPLVAACESGAGCAGARIVNWNGDETLICGGTINFLGCGIPVTQTPASPEPVETLFACGCALLIKRELFVEVGGFDDDFFMFAEDVDLGWRLTLLGHRVVAVPGSVVRHRHGGSLHQTDTAFQKSLSIRNPMLAMVKNYEEANLSKALPAALLLAMSRVMSHLGVEGHDEAALSAFERRLGSDREAVIMAMANLAALDGFFSLLDNALERRRPIQAARKISDEAIAERFNVKLGYDGYMAESNYSVQLVRLAERFDLGRLIAAGEPNGQLRELDKTLATLRARLATAEDELRAVKGSRSWRFLSRLFRLTGRLGFK